MDKQLGKEYGNPKDRMQFLRDNCDKVEEIGYMKPLKTEEIEQLKETLTDNCILLKDIREEKKEAVRQFNEQIKQLQERKDEATKKLKERSEFVREDCYKFIDHDSRQVGYYNAEGNLVQHRPARPEESQLNMFRQLVTGTEG